MIETIEQAFKPHDKYQIEIKLDYELQPEKETHYQIITYFFVPQSLGINEKTYRKDAFYRDIQNYIRLKTPTLILRNFTAYSTSPLMHIRQTVSIEGWADRPDCKERLIDNFKIFGAMLKSAIREHFNLIDKRIVDAAPNSKIHLMIQNLVNEFLVESGKIATQYRAFYAVFNLPDVATEIFAAYQLTDESMSLLIEESAVEMFEIAGRYLRKESRERFKRALNDLVRSETKHRRALGYSSILQPDDDNEEYIFRVSVLKRYASSILFLSTDIHREGTILEQTLFAVAAGFSMIFATGLAFYFQQRFGNFTFPFFVALVVGYMFKDRIKEIIRSIFAGYLQNMLYDRRIIIRTQDGKEKLGILREKVFFIREENLPKSVRKARNRDSITELDNDGQGENIICYAKDIKLYTDKCKRSLRDGPEITAINDIIRYDIRAYLKKMAEPTQTRRSLDDGELQTVMCHKVYHLNLVSKYKSLTFQKEKIYKRSRLVLNQKGIKRIEHIVE